MTDDEAVSLAKAAKERHAATSPGEWKILGHEILDESEEFGIASVSRHTLANWGADEVFIVAAHNQDVPALVDAVLRLAGEKAALEQDVATKQAVIDAAMEIEEMLEAAQRRIATLEAENASLRAKLVTDDGTGLRGQFGGHRE